MGACLPAALGRLELARSLLVLQLCEQPPAPRLPFHAVVPPGEDYARNHCYDRVEAVRGATTPHKVVCFLILPGYLADSEVTSKVQSSMNTMAASIVPTSW